MWELEIGNCEVLSFLVRWFPAAISFIAVGCGCSAMPAPYTAGDVPECFAKFSKLKQVSCQTIKFAWAEDVWCGSGNPVTFTVS